MGKTILLCSIDDPLFVDIGQSLAKRGVNVFCTTKNYTSADLSSKINIPERNIVSATIFTKPSDEKLEYYYNSGIENFSSAIWNSQNECFHSFYSLIDSLSVVSNSLQTYQKLYKRIFLYWLGFFSRQAIDCVFFPSTPNQGWDNILFYIARSMKIKTRVLFRTSLADRVFFSIGYGLDEEENLPVKIKSSTDKYDFENENYTYRKSSWGNYSNLRNEIAIEGSAQDNFVSIKNKTENKKFKALEKKFEAVNEKTSFFLNSNNIVNQNFIYKRYLDHVKKLRQFYDDNTSSFLRDCPFIIVALHCDPGRTTQPEAGVFEDQFLAIQILERALPEDWCIYLKEHPRQFDKRRSSIKQLHYRSIDDYNRLLSLKKVKLLPVTTNLSNIIVHAQAAMTCTGSIGWEALEKGVPAIVFGKPWYSGCDSCYPVASVFECKRVMKELSHKTTVSVQDDVRNFLKRFYPKTFLGTTRYMFTELSEISYDKLLNSMVKNFLNAV